MNRASDTERFEARFVPEPMSGCFLWIGAAQHDNGRMTRKMERYGYFYANKRQYYAHRFAWEQAHGPIPSGKHVLHTCDNPVCVNVAHLRLGDHRSNMTDMKKRERQARGEKQHKAKLTAADIQAIRSSREPLRAAASRYGVHYTTISDIRRRRSWTHLR